MIHISNCQVTKHIYESANSFVYRGLRDDDRQPMILKVLKEDYPTPEELTRYRQEYDMTRRLADVEGVVKAYSLEKHHNTLVMCLEDFGAESLKIWLDQQYPFTLDELLTVAIQITDILGHIHGQNIIHKDLNPSNIVLNPASGVLKIIDFGISTQLSQQHLTLKHPNVLEGTLAYMSPEQTGRMNRTLDYRTDFYSLGATFYELFTGKVPFESNDAMESVHCHIAKHPTPPHHMNPELPLALSHLILKLLEKTAEARYQSAWGIKADLEKLQKTLTGLEELSGLDFELAQHDISDRFQIPQKLYGRERERDTLLAAFERVASGKTEIMLVAGYSGIGKSALVKEIYQSLTAQQGYFISGKFDQFQRNIPYSAVVNAFKELAQQLLTETEIQLAQWKERLFTALGPNGQVIIDVLPEIELIIGKQPPLPQLGATESQNRFNLVFQNFMRVFCQPERPLVIFLDDLQWVDSATLKLLEFVTTDRDNTALFLIGAYRDNEVDPTHPLLATLDTLREERVTMNCITLHPLAFGHIQQLIAESVHHTPLEAVSALTDLVMRKTGGNPFFVNQFLHTLYEENLLHFVPPTSAQKAHWQWDIDHIERLNITDNVVELMIGKLKKLPDFAQHVLRLAACVGNHFDLDTLSVIYEQSAIATFQDLMPVLTEGFIVPVSEPEIVDDPSSGGSDMSTSHYIIQHFQFLHDRVQQAAYALIDDERKHAMHLQIGRLILNNTPADVLEEHVFDIVGHVNHSIELLKNQLERREIAQLNLMAGQKAKMATAYGAAVNYFTIGRECLPDKSWERDYDLTLNLFTEAAEAAYLSGDYTQMEHLVHVVLHHARTLSDEANICEMQILAYSAQNQQLKAVETAIIFLKRLGVSFPEEPTPEDIGSALQELRVSLSGKPIQSLIDLPRMTSPHSILAMRIMVVVTPPAYLVLPQLMILLVLKQVALSLEYGNVSESSFSYVCYGFILCGIAGDIESGYQFGLLALDLLERSGEQRLTARDIFTFNDFVRPWKKHVSETLHPLLENYQTGLETGDVEFAALSIEVYPSYSYFTGKSLVTLAQEMAQYSHALAQLQQAAAHSRYNVTRQVVLNLRGHADHPCRLAGEVYDETVQLPIHQRANDRTTMYFLYIHTCILHYLFQEYAPAVENAEIAEQYADGVTGMFMVVFFHFYDSLARLALYPDLPQPEQEAVLAKVAAHQEKMKHWAHHAPMNFQHKYDLVEAEKARVTGQNWHAVECYEKAIAGAKEHEYLNEEALAYELAGQFYLATGHTQFAQVCLYEAHYAYQQWGATAKVRNLEARYPQFVEPKTARTIPGDAATSTTYITSTSTSDSEELDLSSIMKAAQTLSGEIVLSRLLENMMHIVIENAGAEKGVLLLPKHDRWCIEAEGHVDTEKGTVLHSIALEESDRVSPDIIRYVVHTRKNVVLRDATREGSFTRDAYIMKQRPKSVLCAPLLNQGELTGILYLENNVTTGAFTPERVDVLQLLSSQIAISIENSLLYDNLEQKVAERTSELEQEIVVRQRAEAAANVANQAKSTFIANMSHELRSPLTAILGFARVMTRSQRLDPDNLDNLGIITSSGEHLLSLINQVLDLSKIEAGKMTLNPRPFDLARLLDDVEDMFRLKAEEKHLQLVFERAPDVPLAVRTDEVKLRQVIINLLNNALKFTERGGITVRVKSEKCQVSNDALHVEHDNPPLPTLHSSLFTLHFEISDTGPGIAPEEMSKLFEAFEQTSSGRQSQEGTGLGLPISRKFVRLMGGDMQVRSQVGEGTTFRFDIEVECLAEDQTPTAHARASRVLALEPGQPRSRILVVDDKPMNRLLLVKLLQPLGFEVREAEHGEEAICVWEEWEPHLIWMDLRMPVMDGYSATRDIRHSESDIRHVPIIALSASSFEEERKAALSNGCDDFLRKPFSEQAIFDALTTHLGVRFVYAEETPLNTPDARDVDLPAALAQLPPELPEQLRYAVTHSDVALIDRVIDDMRAYQPAAADVLGESARNFQYEQILRALQKEE